MAEDIVQKDNTKLFKPVTGIRPGINVVVQQCCGELVQEGGSCLSKGTSGKHTQ